MYYNKKHMKAFLAALSRVDESHFHISAEYGRPYADVILTEYTLSHACGATACAGGWAAIDPECNKLGFKALKNIHGSLFSFTYKNTARINALIAFLEMDSGVAKEIFGYSLRTREVYGKQIGKITCFDVMVALEYYCLTGELIEPEDLL